MIWVTDIDRSCTYVNRAWLEFTGRSFEAELGNGWADGIHPDDRAKCLETWVQVFDRREPLRMEYRVRRHDGAYRWIIVSMLGWVKPSPRSRVSNAEEASTGEPAVRPALGVLLRAPGR